MAAMDAGPARLALALEQLGADAERVGPREWGVRLPSEARGAITAGIGCGERTVVLRAFFLRGPDRDHESVYRLLLRRNLDLRVWRFALDPSGDVHLVADVPVAEVTADRLDELLGQLVVCVDETFERTMRLGFDVPAGVRVTGAPPPPPPAGG